MSTRERMQRPLQLDPRMTPGDALFWFSEAAVPHLRMHVAALFMLDRAPDPRRFRAAMERLAPATCACWGWRSPSWARGAFRSN